MNREEAKGLLAQLMEALVKRRKQLKLSQREVGKRMGIVQSHVSDMEAGNRDITVTTLFRYADAVNLRLQLTNEYLD